MNLDDRLKNVAVLGAGGKMGSGISLLLSRVMTLQKLKPENKDKEYQINLIDVNPDALKGLENYLKAQAKKYAQKNFENLKSYYPDSMDEETLSNQFVEDLSSILNLTTQLNSACHSFMIFEAIIENIDLKLSIFKQLNENCSGDTFFFSNTSSIPIKSMDEGAGLNGRIIGFHFYNPPAVQKLVEIIIPQKLHPDFTEIAYELGRRLEKILIPCNDIAGFIGNGHFTRDGLHAISEAENLQREMSAVQAIYIMNKISRDFLVRPMGIFQLIDYVGLDVFQSILKIMNPHFEDENLHSELIDKMVAAGVKGGQYPDGSQKDGFLKYENGKPNGFFDLNAGQYISYEEGTWKTEADHKIGDLPREHKSWKELLKDPGRNDLLNNYFNRLKSMDTKGAQLALQYLKRSKEIGEQLVSGGVANNAGDINGVLMNGFFHLYGPVNEFV